MDDEKIRTNAFNETRQKEKKRNDEVREEIAEMQTDSRKTYVISL